MEQVRVLSRCLKCHHLQEYVIKSDGLYGVCVNKLCQREELIVHGWKLYSKGD